MKRTIIIALSLVLVLLAFTSCEEEIHVHTWDEGTVTKAATCSEKGVKTYTCTGCKETKTEDIAIDPDNHTWDEGKETTPVTCEKDGEKIFTCTECEETKTEIIKTSGHDFKDTITTPAGYLTEGSKRVECTLCDYVEDSVPVEKKSLKGAWFESKIGEMVINLVYPTDENNPGKIYSCGPIIESTETYQPIVDSGIEFTASISIEGDEMFITIIDLTAPEGNLYKKQTLTISETVNEGVPKIIIKGLHLMDKGPLDITLSPVQAHSFEGEPEPKELWTPFEEMHVKAIICNDEHEGEDPKYALFDYYSMEDHKFSVIKKEPTYFTKGFGESCILCGFASGDIEYLPLGNTTWISEAPEVSTNDKINGKYLVLEFTDDENVIISIKDGSGNINEQEKTEYSRSFDEEKNEYCLNLQGTLAPLYATVNETTEEGNIIINLTNMDGNKYTLQKVN